MPHIIYKGIADLRAAHSTFEAMKADSNGWLIRLNQLYLTSNGETLLFDCTAVRSGFVQGFYALAEQKGNRVTLRIDPHTSVARNEGVKRTLLIIRDYLLRTSPNLEFDKSNLPPEILSPVEDFPPTS